MKCHSQHNHKVLRSKHRISVVDFKVLMSHSAEERSHSRYVEPVRGVTCPKYPSYGGMPIWTCTFTEILNVKITPFERYLT